MCKDGQVQKAYELAKADLEKNPANLWVHREMAWVLNHQMKNDADTGNYQNLIAHIDELKTLDLLSIPDDNIVFDNVLFKIAGFVRHHVAPTDVDTPAKLSTIFSKLKSYDFEASKGYSFLLSSFVRCSNWHELADFLDWWDLDKLTQEDYTPYQMDNGRQIMSVAEQAFIAQSKALLALNDRERKESFLPKLNTLMETHPEMTYPGYFYGKLLLSLGTNTEEALRVVIPFARKKSTEFWVWQLLSDVFVNESDKQLACLIRAVNCHTQEHFLGKVRIKLASLYIQKNMYDYAKFQIDKVTQCYLSQGWHVPPEIANWINQSWINNVTPKDGSPIDYMAITNEFLCEGTDEAIAVVTYFDKNSQKTLMVHGLEKRMSPKLRFKANPGTVLKINYIEESDGKPKILNAERVLLPDNLSYAKIVEGTINKKKEQPFAFLLSENGTRCYVPPSVVAHSQLADGQTAKCLIVNDYDKKNDRWSWVCLKIIKII